MMLDDRQDYFGPFRTTSPRAVQELADPTAILATKSIVNAAEAAGLVGASGYRTSSRQLRRCGASAKPLTIYMRSASARRLPGRRKERRKEPERARVS